jgi:hypothetical protein
MKLNQSYTKKPPRRDEIVRFTKKYVKMMRQMEKIFPKEMECKITMGSYAETSLIEIRDQQDEAFQHDAMFPQDTYMDQSFADSLADALHEHIGDHLRRRR